MKATPLLLISGPVGVGKTTIGEEVSNSLVKNGVAHSLIDMDCLAETYPRPDDDRFGSRLALMNLRDVWAKCAAAGSRNLIVPRVIESQKDIKDIQSVLPNSKAIVCLLHASNSTLIERVRKRELGSGRDWHEQRSIELSQRLQKSAPADLVVDTEGRSPIDIANEVVGKVAWVTST